MRKIFLAFLTSFAITAGATNELDLELNKYYKSNGVVVKNESVPDYTLIRRLYLDLAGRVPTLEEAQAFSKARFPNKKELIIDKLLFSEDYVNNFYNFFADLYRIRPERLSDNIQMKGYPYIQYIRNSLREDKSYNVLAKELLTATGKPTQNGATGYILRDDGMAFDNIALTTQIFLGKSTTCQACHDDPFGDGTQKEFYELAAFFNNDNRENRKDYRDILKKVDDDIKIINKNDRIDNTVRQLLGSNLVNIVDNPNKQVKYPPDYRYSNAKPGEIAKAVSLDGKLQDIKDNKRTEVANWIISKDEFSYAIANRIWVNIVGNNLFYPQNISDFSIEDAKNKELIKFLGNYLKEHNYSIKSLVRLIALSDFYSRQSFLGTEEGYKFQGILVKRMTAHQIWDSIVTLVLDDPNYTRISFEKYSDLFEVDWNKISGQSMLAQVAAIRDWDNSIINNVLKYKGVDLVRSCFNLRGNNGFIGLFLKEFGASERVLLDTTSDLGTVTQLLTLMNSPIIQVVTDSKSQVMKSGDKNTIFASMMTRPAGIFEKSFIEKSTKEDLVWILLNSHEYLFRK